MDFSAVCIVVLLLVLLLLVPHFLFLCFHVSDSVSRKNGEVSCSVVRVEVDGR